MAKIKMRVVCLLLALSLLAATACGREGGNQYDPGEEPVAVGEAREIELTAEGAVDNMKFSMLPLGQVKAGSWLKNQLLLQAENVTKHFEELSPDCCAEGDGRSGWLGGSGESWERGTYYVRGLIASAYVLDDAELKAQAQKWIEWTLASQAESGAFGPLANNPDSLDYWPLMPMLMALEFYCDATGDERVVPFLQKYFAWEAKALKRRPLYSWAEARGGDNIFAVWWLYERTGDEALLDLCKLLYKQTYNWDAAYDAKAWSETYHIVNVQQSFKLFPIMYALTGDEHYLDVYYKGIENIYMAAGRQDGMSNGDELTRGIDAVYGNETCAVVERMLCDEIALMLLRDATIADHLELISYNALPQQLLSDGRGQVYFTMQNQVAADMGNHGFTSDGGDRSVYGLPGGYPCCVHNYQIGWPLFIASMWFSTSDGGLAAGAYGPNSVTATVGDGTRLTIVQTTNYPFEDRVTLTLSSDKTDTYPIYIRVPEWCRAASVRVNGHPLAEELRPGQYFRLSAEWHDGDVITLDFPAELTATLTDNNSVSIRRGAVLFALKIDENYEKIEYNPNHWNLNGDYPSYNITAASAWNYALENFSFTDVASNFKLTRKKLSDDMRFQLSDAPIVLEAKARTVSDWTLNTAQNIAGDTPVSPVSSERLKGKTATVKLVPYAFTRLRITHIPWTGTLPEHEPSRPDENSLLFASVIAPYEKHDVQEGTKKLTYTIDFTYETPRDLTLSLELDRTPAGSVTLSKGSGKVSVETDLLRSDRHNRVLLTSADGSPIPGELKLTIAVTVNVVDTGAVRYEAETAWLTGSAYRSTRHVAGIDDVGSSLTFDKFEIPADGEYTLRFYYAAALGLATHTVFIDGVNCGRVRYNENGKTLGWGCFDNDIYADIRLTLNAGTHTLRIEKTADDVGFAELDAFDLIRQ
ncbi:MAG: glycoside hydrolase family 127 protein [Clostridia bacterium]|nr:glycoside hydrolase family 127 protein [Clostridia bacterium]